MGPKQVEVGGQVLVVGLDQDLQLLQQVPCGLAQVHEVVQDPRQGRHGQLGPAQVRGLLPSLLKELKIRGGGYVLKKSTLHLKAKKCIFLYQILCFFLVNSVCHYACNS